MFFVNVVVKKTMIEKIMLNVYNKAMSEIIEKYRKILPKWTPGIVLFLTAMVYFINLPISYDFDGTVFSHYLRFALIKSDLGSAHQPQHPLYMPLNYVLYKFLNFTIGYRALEYFHLQVFSFIFGLLTVWINYKILYRLTERLFYRVAGMVIIAASYGIWYYSVEAEVHMPGLFFVSAGMYLLFFKSGEDSGWPGVLRRPGAACCFALAAGFHITNGLIMVAVFTIFLVERKPFLRMMRFFFFYGFFLVIELGLFQLLSGIDLLDFYTKQLSGSDVLAGYKISYWDGFTALAPLEALKTTAHGILFPVSSALPLVVLSLLVFAVAVAVSVYGFMLSRKDEDAGVTPYYRLCAWMLPYFLFFSLWDHENIEFKLNIVLPFLLLFVVSASRWSELGTVKRKLPPAAVIIVLLLAGGINFFFSILPANNVEINDGYMVAQSIRKYTPPNSIIVIAGCGSKVSIHSKIYVPYFAFREVYILDWMLGKGLKFEAILARIRQKSQEGTPVYLFSEILHDGKTVRQMLENHKLEAVEYFRVLDQLELGESMPLVRGYYLRKF